MSDKVTAPKIATMKAEGRKIVCLTAYDAYFGALVDEAGVDLILVGDSAANVVLGYPTTVSISMEEMVHHVKAVRRGVQRALLVADMPFGSNNSSTEQAVDSAVILMRAGAEAVKLEGDYPEAIAAMVKAGIPVMGHVGMTPQSVNVFGGFKVQGKGAAGQSVIDAALSIQNAGVFSIVLELLPADLAREVTRATSVPTIGIGGGNECDGQIQVLYDMLGMSKHRFKHAKRYVEADELFQAGIEQYVSEVRSRQFPGPEHSF